MPFNIKQKQTTRGVVNARVSYIDYLEVNAYNNSYRLLQKKKFQKNGVNTDIPFTDLDGKVKVVKKGFVTLFTTEFGLTITFDGNMRQTVRLCDAYKNNVCGLCGNADGNKVNDFVDRKNNIVPIVGPYHTRSFKWGSEWKTPTDNKEEKDIDGSL